MNNKNSITIVALIALTFFAYVCLTEPNPGLTARFCLYGLYTIFVIIGLMVVTMHDPSVTNNASFTVYKQTHSGKQYFVLHYSCGTIWAERNSLEELADVIRQSFSVKKFPRVYFDTTPDFEIELSNGKNPVLNTALTDEEITTLFTALHIKKMK